MGGLFAIVHVLRLALDMLGKYADWAKLRRIQRQTITQLRLKSRSLLEKASLARRTSRRRNDASEQLHADDGYRRD
jgi:hypothetical protein